MSHIVIDARLMNSTTGRYIERLVHYLEELDHLNKYTLLMLEKDINFYKPSNVNFSVAVADFEQFSFAEQIGFKKLLDSLKPDLVHFCMPQQPILYTGKHVTTFHDMILIHFIMPDKNQLVYRFKQLVGGFVFKRVARTSKYLITPTEYTKKDLVEYTKIKPDKVVVTYEAVGATPAKISPYKLPFKKYILYVGQQAEYKNVKRLGDAHQKLLKKHPDLGLVLVGKKDSTTDINENYFKSKSYKNIVFTGFVSDEELGWLYQNAEVYVFPSLAEGFGLPGLEAMMHGAPVASSNYTCLPEVYGDAAHYFNPKDVKDMASIIDDILSDSTLRSKLIQNGTKQIKKYSWLKMAKETHAVYMKALKD